MHSPVIADAPEMSAVEAARRLGVDLNRVYVLLRLGRVAGRKIDGQWRVSSLAVEERLRERAAAKVRP
jgi:hypothetical protein